MRSFVFPQLGKKPISFDAIKLPSLKWVNWKMSRLIPDGFVSKQGLSFLRDTESKVMLRISRSLANIN